MKKRTILYFIILTLILTLTSGCYSKDELEGSTITITVYPIEYLTERLYGYNSTINSIYPNDTNTDEYELTDKQIKDYAKKTNLFIYNGLSSEKDLAKTLINKNKNIQIIDAAYGIKYKYGIEELWLHPNNYLMLANTIKNDLEELSSSKYTAQKIEENYTQLEEELSILDAEFRNLAKLATKNGKNTVVIAYDTFGYLEDYGFEVINISNENNITTTIKNKFKDKTYKYIFVKDAKNTPDYIKDIVDNYGTELIEIDTMDTLTDKQKADKDNYLTIMNDFLSTLSNIVLN